MVQRQDQAIDVLDITCTKVLISCFLILELFTAVEEAFIGQISVFCGAQLMIAFDFGVSLNVSRLVFPP